ncbi:MAG: hypothetical protein OXC68_00940 [Aestuariivita sp.]|nr:hypothetical protein [Aestuariivita sp.]
MAIKKTILWEFHSYAKLLNKTKKDIEKIINAASSQLSAEERIEDIVPRLKRILERIVYGCLEVQIPIYGKKVSGLNLIFLFRMA